MTDLIERIWQKDTSLWSTSQKEQAAITQLLGWLEAPGFLAQHKQELLAFARQIIEQRFTQVVLLGMGGSSLCPYMLSAIFGSAPGFPQMFVLDSTDPDLIQQVEARVNLTQTLFIVASKSGRTIEPLCLFKYFYTRLSKLKADPGENFLAITDAGSPLVKLANEHGFRHTFINPSDIGGRYSALSYFGLVPAALMGINLEALEQSLLSMEAACKVRTPPTSNPALELAIYIAQMVDEGKDKLTILLDSCLAPFGLWLEQLLAESTGKKGTGIIPIVGELMGSGEEYGRDRCFVSIGLQGHEEKSRLDLTRRLKEANLPLMEFSLQDPYQLAGEFLRWELATVLCGHLLDINPFDEPNVAESKKNTQQILSRFMKKGQMPQKLVQDKHGWSWQGSPNLLKLLGEDRLADLTAGLEQFFANTAGNGYFGLLAYLPHQPEVEEAARQIRSLVSSRLGCATVFGFGPRYLHSSGQVYKGGPENGSFLIITRAAAPELDIPGEAFNFWQLQFAQALGDFKSLADKGRLVMHLHFESGYQQALSHLLELIKKALA